MAGEFTSQINLVRKATAERIDNACLSMARALMTDIINDTPVSPGKTADGQRTNPLPSLSDNPGQLVNNWNFSVNTPNYTTTTRSAPNRQGPLRRMQATIKKGIFLNQDNIVYMCNGLHYAWNAEYLGWDGYAPYRMVAKNVQKWSTGAYQFTATGRTLLPV